MQQGKLIIFSAPSGAGKTTIVNAILKHKLPLQFSISATSRPKREGEEHGVNYYFLSADEFRAKIKQDAFLEWEMVYEDQYYGTLKSEVDRIHNLGNHVLFDIDVVGGSNLKKMFGDQALAIFIMPPSIEELENRLRGRSTEDEASLKKRLDKSQFELGYSDQFDKVVVNDDLDTAIAEVKQIILDFIQ